VGVVGPKECVVVVWGEEAEAFSRASVFPMLSEIRKEKSLKAEGAKESGQ
jgi:hypothetical protein